MTSKEKLREALRFLPLPDVLNELADHVVDHERRAANDKAYERRLRRDAYEDKSKEWKRAETAELYRNIWCITAIIGWCIAGFLLTYHH